MKNTTNLLSLLFILIHYGATTHEIYLLLAIKIKID